MPSLNVVFGATDSVVSIDIQRSVTFGARGGDREKGNTEPPPQEGLPVGGWHPGV